MDMRERRRRGQALIGDVERELRADEEHRALADGWCCARGRALVHAFHEILPQHGHDLAADFAAAIVHRVDIDVSLAI